MARSNPARETNQAPNAARAPLASREALSSWVKVHRGPLVGILRERGAKADEAEEAVQEGLFKLWKNRTKIRQNDDKSLRKYVRTVAHNWLVQRYKERRREVAPDDAALSSLPSPDEPPDKQAELLDFLEKAAEVVKSLSPAQQDVFRLLWNEGRTVDEIAEELGMPKSTVRSHKHRIIRKFRRALGLPPARPKRR